MRITSGCREFSTPSFLQQLSVHLCALCVSVVKLIEAKALTQRHRGLPFNGLQYGYPLFVAVYPYTEIVGHASGILYGTISIAQVFGRR